eukprot:jgi/Botrbrau1/5413/Bobra.182_1s0017.1
MHPACRLSPSSQVAPNGVLDARRSGESKHIPPASNALKQTIHVMLNTLQPTLLLFTDTVLCN